MLSKVNSNITSIKSEHQSVQAFPVNNNMNIMNPIYTDRGVISVRKYINITLVFLLMMIGSSDLFAQSSTCVSGSVDNSNNDPWSEECYMNNSCGLQGNPCTANDVNMTGTFLADQNGNPLSIFNPGDQIQVYLWGNFQNGTNTDRYAVRTSSEMYLDGAYSTDLNDCSFDLLPPGESSALLLGPITFTYGQEIELYNTWVAWETSAAQCSNSGAPDYNSLCGQYASSKCSREFDPIQTIIPNFSYSCGDFTNSSIEVCFQDITSGGEKPFTYLWEFGDGSTSTSSAPCHTYNAI